LNNLKVRSILEPQFSAHFVFLEREVETLLQDYRIETRMEDVRQCYNGYLFGDHVIYNPWSILNYVDNWSLGTLPYWVNASGNEQVRRLLLHSDSQVKKDLEDLLLGTNIEKEVSDHLVFGEIEHNPDAIWSFLLLSGYLTVRSVTVTENGAMVGSLTIPNKEVGSVYRGIFHDWFRLGLTGRKHRELLEVLTGGDTEVFQSLFADYAEKTFSYLDTGGDEPENMYHSFTLGLLVSLWDAYEIKSNRESGYGRYDVMLIPRNAGRNGIVIEFKKVNRDRGETLDSAVGAALKQIEGKQYASESQERGVRDILCLGIAIDGKRMKIRAHKYT
jgi:hypothetical protein